MDYNALRKIIVNAFHDAGEYTPEVHIYDEGNEVGVEVDGDWYHDHALADDIMRRLGWTKTDEVEHGDSTDTDDWYESEHRYKRLK